MRKMLILLFGVLILASFCGCGRNEEAVDPKQNEEQISPTYAPEYYTGASAVSELETALKKDGETIYCIPVKVPYQADFTGFQRQAGTYVEALYQLETENQDEGVNLAYSLNPGNTDTRMESVVYNNRELYEELDWQGRTIYYTYDDLMKDISPRHCFVYPIDEGLISVAIPEKLLVNGESVTLTREEAMEYIDVEVVQVG